MTTYYKHSETPIRKVAVFCSASNKVMQDYKNLAYSLGAMLATNGYELVYGGGEQGLMGEVARGAIDNQGVIHGILPHFLTFETTNAQFVTQYVESMSARKRDICHIADAYIILPGGFGTLDELFEVLTLKQIGQESKPIYLLDSTHDRIFSSAVHNLCNVLIEIGTIQKEDMNAFDEVQDLEELSTMLEGGFQKDYQPKVGKKDGE